MKKKTVSTQITSYDSLGIEQVGKLRMERMQRTLKNPVKLTERAYGTMVLQTNSKIIKNLLYRIKQGSNTPSKEG